MKTTSPKTETAARPAPRLRARLREARAFVRRPRPPHGLAHACVCAALIFAWALPGARDESKPLTSSSSAPSEDEFDESLRRAALNALGGREGTILILDARTGRVRAAVNPRVAFEETFAPGSTVKPFTMLEALRAGVVGEGSRVVCRHSFRHEDFHINCAHPPTKEPFGPAQALAQSCNYFFGRAGERVDGAALARTLAAYGFGARTGGAEQEAAGRVPPRDRWRVSDALGESEQLLVTPAQLVSAYAALFNGGRLYAPRAAAAEGFSPRVRASLEIEDEHRATLVEGMRGAVSYGSAARADLNTLPVYVFGKTGTSTPPGDFRTQGWFVGFAAERDAGGAVPPGSVGLAVLVFLKRGHGSEAAEVARPVFREHARGEESRRAATLKRTGEAGESESAGRGRGEVDEGSALSPQVPSGERVVRVHLSRADRTLALPLDEYVFGVVAAEGSVEDEFEALKAQAVVSRTYALKNLRRHAREGFDFCSSTHCQRYVSVGDGSARPDFYELLGRAVRETSGETLRDREGRLADSYFSASCGGATADPRTLWGASHSPPHLRGVRDDFCAGTAYHAWRDSIPAADLLKALSADERTDVGARLDAVRVLRRDASGRAEAVALEGERRRVVRGWDFKLVVGRTLGWNVLKSSRFDVRREGGNFVFRGSGFGHGLGLCQSGAHVMARRGAPYRQIIGHFFPGASVGTREKRSGGLERADAATQEKTWDEASADASSFSSDARDRGAARDRQGSVTFQTVAFQTAAFHESSNVKTPRAADGVPSKTLFSRATFITDAAPDGARETRSPRLMLSSEHFRVSYPARAARREVEAMLRALEGARRDVVSRLEGAGVNAAGLGTAEVYVHETTGDFTGATGLPSWVAASTRGRRIESQPAEVLRRRGVLSSTMRHEFVHVALETLGRGRAPLWLVEGLAAHIAAEGAMLSRAARGARKLSAEEIERGLLSATSAQETRALYYAAFAEVAALIRREGEAAAWRRALRG